jgi:osmotically-inducible protein OsmY
MKTRKADWIVASALVASLTFAIRGFAQSGSQGSTAANHAAGIPSTTTSAATGVDNGNSWKDSLNAAAHNLNDAAQNVELASEKAYDRVAQDVNDLSLETRIRAMLHENKYARGSDVRVTANNGVVTLTGQVPSQQSARHVQEVVAGVYGVKAVHNDLNYPRHNQLVTPRDADSMGVAHPAYSHTAPAESAPDDH